MENNELTREKLNEISKDGLIEIILSQALQLEQLNRKLNILIEQVALGKQHRFGKSSEKNLSDGEQITMYFNEAEALQQAISEEPTMEEVVPSYRRRRGKKAKGKLEENLKDFPSRIECHTLSDEILRELFPEGYRNLPDEIYKKLEFHPASFEVVEHHIKVYRGRKDSKIVRAEHPKEMLNHSVATPSLTAAIINAKYVNAVPLYRQEQEFKRNDVNISRQDMAGWLIKVSERYFSLIEDRLKECLLRSSVIHADETPVLVNKDGREGTHKNYMWVYRTGTMCDTKPVILYDYQKTRKAEHPANYLESYSGTLVCDGYQVYHTLGKEDSDRLTIAGCWAHARRNFADVCKSVGKDSSKGTVASQALALISGIYKEDNKLLTLDPDERLSRRQIEIAPLVDAFFAWLRESQKNVLSESKTGKGIKYCLNQEPYLRAFLKDGEVPLDNNAAELAIRPFCVGKNNWKMIDTIHGASASATIYSIVETAKANNLKPYNYFEHLLTEIPKHMDDTNIRFIDELLPWSKSLPAACYKKQL